MMHFELVEPIREHAELVMAWRNDPTTLSMFYHSEPKVMPDFFEEFVDTYFTEKRCPPVFAVVHGERVAFVKFDRYTEYGDAQQYIVDISINVKAESRGQGLGPAILRHVSHYLRDKGVDGVIAEIKKKNRASIRSFEKAGFVYVDEQEKEISSLSHSVSIVRMYKGIENSSCRGDAVGVYVIAEAGSNWRVGSPARDLAMAKSLIDVAVDAGADAVKFQTYKPETVYVENAGESEYLSDAGIKQDIFSIFKDLSMPYDMIPKLADYCKECRIDFMSTPFSIEDAEAIDPYVTTHKLASYEISHAPLIEWLAQRKKHLVMSTGGASCEDIQWAVDHYFNSGGQRLTLLQCTAKYPAPLATLNLKAMSQLQEKFGVEVGLSDHSRDPVIGPVGAVAMGATVVEKHYTLHNALPGPDHSFAVCPDELKLMVSSIRKMEEALGDGVKRVQAGETELRHFAQRAVQATREIAKGDALRLGFNVDVLRPGKQSQGVHPKFLNEMEGKGATRDIRAGEGVAPGDWK